MLHVLNDLSSGEGSLEDLLPFLEAACQKSKIGVEIENKEKRKEYVTKSARRILNYDVAQLIRQVRVTKSSNLWGEMVETVFHGVERVVVDHEHPLTYRPDVPLEGLRDKAPSVEEAYEREQKEQAVAEFSAVPALRSVVASADSILSTINSRTAPLYSLMKKRPSQYGFLWGLFVALWPHVELFEALMENYAGAKIEVPKQTDCAKAELLRNVLQLRQAQLTQAQIASKLGITQPRVNQLLKEWDSSRSPERELDEALIKELNKGLNCRVLDKIVDAIRAL
jgi:predicted XRE-type DNA-binding protein